LIFQRHLKDNKKGKNFIIFIIKLSIIKLTFYI
jgi:hypothetical protein